MEKVGIVAVTQTKYERSKPSLRETEIVYEVVEKVLQQAGLTYAENGTGIDATVTCASDHWDGETISNLKIADVTGGHLRPEEKVCDDGAFAAYYGLIQILSGHYDIVLVVAYTKESQTSRNIIENFGFDAVYQRILGIDFLSAAAMQANRYMNKYKITPEQCAQVVVKNRKNAKNNPYAQALMEPTVEDVLNSPMVANPIHELDCKPTSDGACAMILAREEKAKKITEKPVWIMGIGSCYDAHYLGDRDLADCKALEVAAQRAYKMAGIKNTRKELSLVELSEEYSYQELLWSEGLGLCSRGEGGKLIESGVTHIGGEIPINPSGGLLSGVPVNVAGLSRVAEATLQLQGEAQTRQVDGAKVALAHGVTGPCGQTHCVLILGR